MRKFSYKEKAAAIAGAVLIGTGAIGGTTAAVTASDAPAPAVAAAQQYTPFPIPAGDVVIVKPMAYTANYGNLVTIAKYLMAHGATRAAAAGIAGTIFGESAGDPEATGSGGFGLIGWTGNTIGLPAGYHGPTGNPSYDLQVQMAGVIGYISANGGMARINAQGSVNACANYFSRYYERPAVLYSDTRPSVAAWVYGQLGGVSTSSGGSSATATSAHPVIRQGSVGSAVREAQGHLNRHNTADIAVDGIFGPKTHAATDTFQKSHGLVVDAIIGPKTWAKLHEGTGTAAAAGSYTVRAGDTLSELAQQFHTTVAHLVANNGIANPNLIYVGQVLKI